MISYRLFISGQNSNFNGKFKLELITICHLRFVVKVLWKYCGRSFYFLKNQCMFFINMPIYKQTLDEYLDLISMVIS